MKATELTIKLALTPGKSMVEAINRIIACVNTGHYQGKTVSPSTFKKDGYNFSYTKQNTEYESIEF